MKERNIALSILFSIITCGIYAIYWIVMLNDETNYMAGEQDGTSGIAVILFSIITCGIYSLYWAYKMGEKLNQAKTNRGMMPESSSGILYLILCIIGLGVVAYALMQNELNKVIRYDNQNTAY